MEECLKYVWSCSGSTLWPWQRGAGSWYHATVFPHLCWTVPGLDMRKRPSAAGTTRCRRGAPVKSRYKLTIAAALDNQDGWGSRQQATAEMRTKSLPVAFYQLTSDQIVLTTWPVTQWPVTPCDPLTAHHGRGLQRDAFFYFRDEIDILFPSVSRQEQEFFYLISWFETRSRILFTLSQALRRDQEFLSFNLKIWDVIKICQWKFLPLMSTFTFVQLVSRHCAMMRLRTVFPEFWWKWK